MRRREGGLVEVGEKEKKEGKKEREGKEERDGGRRKERETTNEGMIHIIFQNVWLEKKTHPPPPLPNSDIF